MHTFVHTAYLLTSVSVSAGRVLLPPLTAFDGLTTHIGPLPRPSLDQSCFSCLGPEALLAVLSHPQQSHLWSPHNLGNNLRQQSMLALDIW